MKFSRAVGVLSLSASCGVAAGSSATKRRSDAGVTPLNKVLQMLGDMVAKGTEEKHEEEVAFAKFSQWCDSTRSSLTKSIEAAAGEIVELKAAIAKAEADAEQLAEDIKELEASIAADTEELESATAMRKKERADYSATHGDLSESIDAIERAIQVLKTREKDVPQSLLQVRDSVRMSPEEKTTIEAFVEMAAAGGDGEMGPPKANAYEFQSGGIVGMLEKLRLKFQDERLVLEKEEMKAKGNFEMLKQKLEDNLKEDKKTLTKKTATKGKRLEEAATAKGDLKTTTEGKAEDEKELSETKTECMMKSEEYEKNQNVRNDEIKAINKAMEILKSDEVSGTADKHLPSLVEVRRAAHRRVSTALVQLRGQEESRVDAVRRQQLVAFLQGCAEKSGSHYLSLMATHAAEDPFGKVKKMIKDLIVKLMEQANAEADQKAFCDTELATNKQTRENKQEEVEVLTSNIEKKSMESAQLAEQIADLSEAVADLKTKQKEATDLRAEEKARNTKTIDEAKAAQVAVGRAINVLKDFYGSVADASLLQSKSEEDQGDAESEGEGINQEMSTAAKAPYTGMQGESGGIMGFLEVIMSDFARLEAQTSSAEDQSASAHQKFMDESSEDAAVKETEIEHKHTKRQNLDAEVGSHKDDLESTQEELAAAMAYYDKLKPDCVDKGLSYEDRVRMREEEIQSLKEALEILNQQDLA